MAVDAENDPKLLMKRIAQLEKEDCAHNAKELRDHYTHTTRLETEGRHESVAK